MASTISAGTTSVTALNLSGDTSGSLSLQTNGNTTALSIDSAQNVTLTNTKITLGTTVLGAGDSSAMKNRIINGAMVIDQRNAGASITPTVNNTYSLDRWDCLLSVASKYSVQQNAGSVTLPSGFVNYLGVTSLSAYSVGASEFFSINQAIEGFNVADLGFGTANAKTITLSFQVYSSLTGTFGGSVANRGASYTPDRSYPFTYSIPVANTWTSISVTIAGDTGGTWYKDNTPGLGVNFSLGTGSTLSGTAGSWATANYRSATGATSVVGTNGATFYITGVQLEVGSSATGFEYRQYQQELALCQRYYEVLTYNANAELISSYLLTITFYKSWWYFKINKRASPTITLVSGSWSNQTPTAYAQIESVLFTNGVGYFYATGTSGNVGLTASAEL